MMEDLPTKNNISGIFLEFPRWLESVKVTPRGVIYVGKPQAGKIKALKEHTGIRIIKPIAFPAQSRLSCLLNLDLSAYNIIYIDSPGQEYELVSDGLPAMEVVVIRHHIKQKNKFTLNSLITLMEVVGYDVKYEAEHKNKRIIDLFFIRNQTLQ
jgi:hypothetical protein